MRAKDDNAGQPGTANAALPTRSQDVKRAKHYEGKTLCRLTPELSGGEAVRLDEELDGCDAACSGDDVGARRTRSLSNLQPQNYQL